MKLCRILDPGKGKDLPCAQVTNRGLRNEDDLVTVIDEATWTFINGEGRQGLCTAKFRPDLIVDVLTLPAGDTLVSLGDARFRVSHRSKHCHPGCALDPLDCRLLGRVLFLHVEAPGQICLGDAFEYSFKSINN